MSRKALILVDIQNDFCTGGKLEVKKGEGIVPFVNSIMQDYDFIIATQDWHPAHHASFASSHPEKKPFDIVDLDYGKQCLWPDHCVMGTKGADFHHHLHIAKAHIVIRKGFRKNIDSYSAFFENDQKTPTGLQGYLHEHQIKQIFIVGLATDYCVKYSALDGAKCGFETHVLLEGCRAINVDDSEHFAVQEMKQKGIFMH